ncbi:hypothetical protein [Tychonema sp. BBK16]|uniref:hypothetical protein n=1 Tax=Tychonema sp. BBK16 TaxID=2699888 RepID=UPI001F1B58FD|nr:hypothetical protein [Tychonema sp. BBK16]MCF6375782.1 hypothetical protein [Tychonema sp. BBK16]
MQAKLQDQLSPADAEVILRHLPERIQAALIARAAEIEYPIAAWITISIASFQGHRSIRFRRLQTRTRAIKSRKGVKVYTIHESSTSIARTSFVIIKVNGCKRELRPCLPSSHPKKFNCLRVP